LEARPIIEAPLNRYVVDALNPDFALKLCVVVAGVVDPGGTCVAKRKAAEVTALGYNALQSNNLVRNLCALNLARCKMRVEAFSRAKRTLECGGPPQDGVAVANLTPLSYFALDSLLIKSAAIAFLHEDDRGSRSNLRPYEAVAAFPGCWRS
jgi:hypothetical protein